MLESLEEGMIDNSKSLIKYASIKDDIWKGNHTGIRDHVLNEIKSGADADDILKNGMIATMGEIGEKFKVGELYIPEVLLSARAMNEGMKALEAYLKSDKKEGEGKVLLCTVEGDMHDIGKNMVAIMLRGVGFDVKDIGVNKSADNILSEINDYDPDILGMSALLTTTMPEMKKVINRLIEANIREKVSVMVGGAPVNEKYANDIGADGYGADAGAAVSLAKKLMKNRI